MEKGDSLPIEIFLNIFSYLDGQTLLNCVKTCKQWSDLIQYNEALWKNACHLDFERPLNAKNRFRSLRFPPPTSHKTAWQDMYRIAWNWYRGHTKGFFPTITHTTEKQPCTVIGTPQEHGLLTTLSLSYDNRIIRSNPNYHHLLIQSPYTKQTSALEIASDSPGWREAAERHSIVCHYSIPSSPYLVTGAANGTVIVWNLVTKSLVHMWQGHQGRVLCVSMNDQVVVSGGSDSIIRVWDIDRTTGEHRPARRGMIDILSFTSSQSEWFQGVSEISVNQHMVACASDVSGPILVFSLLTGSLVYELRSDSIGGTTAFMRLRLTPFFLLTKDKISNKDISYPIIPSHQNVIIQRQHQQASSSMGYIYSNEIPSISNMTPYQLAQHYQHLSPSFIPPTCACINVWDLQSGKILYRLLPTLEDPHQDYVIHDIQLSPDFAKVFASIEIRGQQEKLYCWDFSIRSHNTCSFQDMDIMELDQPHTSQGSIATSWVCCM